MVAQYARQIYHEFRLIKELKSQFVLFREKSRFMLLQMRSHTILTVRARIATSAATCVPSHAVKTSAAMNAGV